MSELAIEVLDPDPMRGRGGKRPGAGRPKGYSHKRAKELMESDGSATSDGEAGPTETRVDYAKARAKKETFLAHKAELEFKVQSGEYISRNSVRDATAKAMAAITQTLRSIPDNLERKLGVAPELAEEIGRQIDDTLNDLADELERMHEYGF